MITYKFLLYFGVAMTVLGVATIFIALYATPR